MHMWSSGLAGGSDASNTACNNYTPTSIANDVAKQRALFGSRFPAALPLRTNRNHCMVWSDFDTVPVVSVANGIRLDTNYYFWPPNWVRDVPGVFNGTGMPMRYAKADGTIVDVLQATTQMTDESEQTYPFTVNTLLDRALGPQGYYGAFVANMHTDTATSSGSDSIVASAKARNVPIVSARQMLDWIDGRNSSSFGALAWSGSTLSFSVTIGTGGQGLQVMIPTQAGALHLTGITLNGAPVASSAQTIKGIQYAFVSVAPVSTRPPTHRNPNALPLLRRGQVSSEAQPQMLIEKLFKRVEDLELDLEREDRADRSGQRSLCRYAVARRHRRREGVCVCADHTLWDGGRGICRHKQADRGMYVPAA